MDACISSYKQAYILTHLRAYTPWNTGSSHTYIHTYIHTFIHTCMHTCIYIHAHMHAYIYTYIHTYIHTCIHAYLQTCVCVWMWSLCYWRGGRCTSICMNFLGRSFEGIITKLIHQTTNTLAATPVGIDSTQLVTQHVRLHAGEHGRTRLCAQKTKNNHVSCA